MMTKRGRDGRSAGLGFCVLFFARQEKEEEKVD